MTDSDGDPVARQRVSFLVTAGSGTAIDASSVTDEHGIARTSWTMGAVAGEQQLLGLLRDARSGAAIASATVTATAQPGELAFATQPTSTVAYQPFSPAVQVAVQDMSGSLVRGYTGAITVRMTNSSEGGALTGIQTVGAVTGTAAFNNLTVRNPSPSYTLTASAQGFDPVTSAAFQVVPNTPVALAFQTQPGPSFAGVPVLPSIRVQAVDQAGNPAVSYGGDITISLGGSTGGTNLSGTMTQAAVNGQVTFENLVVDAPASGLMLVASGSGVASGTSSTFSACRNCWVEREPLLSRLRAAAAVSLGGRIYVLGGVASTGLRSVQQYDPRTDRWGLRSPIPTLRYAAASATSNGLIYLTGGFIQVGEGGSETAVVEVYDPVTDTWSTRAPMLTRRREHGLVEVNGILYAIGGVNVSTGTLASVEAYDPATNIWSSKAPLPAARYFPGVVNLNGIVYVAGGNSDDDGSPSVTTLFAYDPVTDTWTSKAPLPMPLAAAATATVDGHMYLIGGCCISFRPSPSVWEYDPAVDTWALKTAVPVNAWGAVAAAVNGIIYLMGGVDANSVDLDRNDSYRP